MSLNDGRMIAALLKQINIKIKKSIRCSFSNYGLTFPQLSVLALLRKNGEMKISDISIKMGLTSSTTSGIVDRLERMELVKRIRTDQDRRVVRVGITEKVNDITHSFEEKLKNTFAQLLDSASEEDLKDIIKGLDKLNNILGEIKGE